jgi:AraC family transcriptional activator of pobA
MNELFQIHKMTAEEAGVFIASPEDPHIHDYEELIVGFEGEVEHFIDFKTTRFKAPYICFVTQGKLHRVKPIIVDGKCSIWVIRFSTEFIPETAYRLYSNYHDHANILMKSDTCFSRILMLCEMMYDTMQQPKPALAVAHDLLVALFTMIEATRDKDAAEIQSYSKTKNTTFRNFLKILEENFHRPEGVEFYAEKLFMSSRNLNLICQSVLQKSVSEIIETRKLIEAKNMMINTDKTISEIGFDLGYNEKAYFTNVFKKKTDLTPTEFRESMQKFFS